MPVRILSNANFLPPLNILLRLRDGLLHAYILPRQHGAVEWWRHDVVLDGYCWVWRVRPSPRLGRRRFCASNTLPPIRRLGVGNGCGDMNQRYAAA